MSTFKRKTIIKKNSYFNIVAISTAIIEIKRENIKPTSQLNFLAISSLSSPFTDSRSALVAKYSKLEYLVPRSSSYLFVC
jgi:hypothetical protein